MIAMLDTNIVSDIVRNPQGNAARKFLQAADGTVCTSIIVAAESRFGVLKRRSAVLASRVEQLFARLPIMPFQPPADRYYAQLRLALERGGTPIGHNDLLIAAHALSLDYVLITNNEREFSRVDGLKIENWLR